MCCSQLCSHCGWLLLKCSAIGIGFNGAETNCRIAHILGILLMNSCNTDRFLATTVVYGLSTWNLIHSADACFLVMAGVGYSRAQLKTLSSRASLRRLPRVLRPRATWALVWCDILNPREVHAKNKNRRWLPFSVISSG